MHYEHAGYAACDHPWVSYRGFVELFLQTGAKVSANLEPKGREWGRPKVMGGGSDLQLLSSFGTHAAQIPRRTTKLCLWLILLLEGRSGIAQLLSGSQQQELG